MGGILHSSQDQCILIRLNKYKKSNINKPEGTVPCLHLYLPTLFALKTQTFLTQIPLIKESTSTYVSVYALKYTSQQKSLARMDKHEISIEMNNAGYQY